MGDIQRKVPRKIINVCTTIFNYLRNYNTQMGKNTVCK